MPDERKMRQAPRKQQAATNKCFTAEHMQSKPNEAHYLWDLYSSKVRQRQVKIFAGTETCSNQDTTFTTAYYIDCQISHAPALSSQVNPMSVKCRGQK